MKDLYTPIQFEILIELKKRSLSNYIDKLSSITKNSVFEFRKNVHTGKGYQIIAHIHNMDNDGTMIINHSVKAQKEFSKIGMYIDHYGLVTKPLIIKLNTLINEVFSGEDTVADIKISSILTQGKITKKEADKLWEMYNRKWLIKTGKLVRKTISMPAKDVDLSQIYDSIQL